MAPPKRRRLTRTLADKVGVSDMPRTISVVVGGGTPPTPPPAGATLYGSGIGMDALGNMQVGGYDSGTPNTYVSQRFVADQSSTIAAVTWYCVGPQHVGYGGGTGGTIRMTLEADNNGIPSGTALATYDFVPGNPAPDLVTRSFPSPGSVIAGQTYHIVHTNIDPQPTVNFVSVDCVFNYNPPTVRQPRWPDNSWGMCRRFSTGDWATISNYTPILQLTYGNGVKHGQAYMQVNLSDYGVIAGTANMVRQRVVPTSSVTVTGAGARIAKTSGTENLVLRLEDGSGNLIDSCSVSTGSVPVRSSPTTANDAGVWVSGTFAQARTLTAGVVYYLRLSTGSNTALWTRPIQQGSVGYGFAAATGFGDGYCERTVNGGASWAQFPTYSTLGDLSFYFTLAG